MQGMLNVRLLLALAGTMAVPHVFAQTLPPSVVACADETDVLKRLSCYDREVARYRTPPAATATPRGSPQGAASMGGSMAATPGTPSTASSAAPSAARSVSPTPGAPSTAAPAAAATTSPAAAAADFGMNGEIKRKEGTGTPEPKKLDKLTARIASISSRPTGEAIYNLEGGQIWVEAESETHLPLHNGEEVTINRGVLGAFYLTAPEVRGIRVKRVR